MQEFFSSAPVMIIIGLVGIAIVVTIGKTILKGICWLLGQVERTLQRYCEAHNSQFGSFLMACSFVAGWFLVNNPLDSPLNTWNNIPLLRIAGILLFAVPIIKIIVNAKLHAPLVLLVKLFGVPFDILNYVVCIVCGVLGCLPDKPKRPYYTATDEKGNTIYYLGKDKDGKPVPIPPKLFAMLDDVEWDDVNHCFRSRYGD